MRDFFGWLLIVAAEGLSSCHFQQFFVQLYYMSITFSYSCGCTIAAEFFAVSGAVPVSEGDFMSG